MTTKNSLYKVQCKLENRIDDDSNRTKAERHAIYLALSGIQRAEETIRSAAQWIRDDLDRIDDQLGTDMRLNSLGELQRKPVELDMAIALREAHWQTLGALLTKDELDAFIADRKAARADA